MKGRGKGSDTKGSRRGLRAWMILPLAVLVGAGVWFVVVRKDNTGSASATTIERTVDVTAGKLSRTVSATGTIEASSTEDLSFASAGTVTAVNVKAGEKVKKGTVLATIDSAELASTVTQAEAASADAQAKLASDQDADASAEQLAADGSNLWSLNAQLAAARTALAGAKLVSPIDGSVATVDLTVGQQLSTGGTSGTGITGTGTGSGQSASTLGSGSSGPSAAGGQDSGDSSTAATSSPQVQVISAGSYLAKLNIDDTDIKNVKVGQLATVSLASAASTTGGFGGPFGGGPPAGGGGTGQSGATATTQPTQASPAASVTGFVSSVGTVATATSGVATFPVDVAFSGSADTYHAGATAQVEITYASVPNAIQVQAQAVSTVNGASTVVVSTAGKKQTRTVTTGITANGMVQITRGLKAGEQVVISITTGARITNSGRTGGASGGGGGGQFTPPAGFGGFPPGGGQNP